MKTLLILATLTLTLHAQQTPAPAKAGPTATTITAPAKKAPKPNTDGTVQVEFTLGELFVAWASLEKLSSLDMAIPTSRALRKNKATVRVELDLFNEQRVDLFKKYGIKDGKIENMPPEALEKLNAEWKTLNDISVNLTIRQIPISALGDGKLSANDIERLELFLIDGTPAKPEDKKEK